MVFGMTDLEISNIYLPSGILSLNFIAYCYDYNYQNPEQFNKSNILAVVFMPTLGNWNHTSLFVQDVYVSRIMDYVLQVMGQEAIIQPYGSDFFAKIY